jgi:hypothetical protein
MFKVNQNHYNSGVYCMYHMMSFYMVSHCIIDCKQYVFLTLTKLLYVGVLISVVC